MAYTGYFLTVALLLLLMGSANFETSKVHFVPFSIRNRVEAQRDAAAQHQAIPVAITSTF